MLDPLILRIISAGLALLFIFAAAHKLGNKLQFRGILEAYQIVPKGMLGLLSNLIPVFELLLGFAWLVTALLLIQIQTVPLLSTMLLTTYVLAIGINLLRGRRYIDCGCGFSSSKRKEGNDGSIQRLSSWLLFRNSLLIVAALIAGFPANNRLSGFMDFFSLIVGSIVVALLYLAFNQLLVNYGVIRAWRHSHG